MERWAQLFADTFRIGGQSEGDEFECRGCDGLGERFTQSAFGGR